MICWSCSEVKENSYSAEVVELSHYLLLAWFVGGSKAPGVSIHCSVDSALYMIRYCSLVTIPPPSFPLLALKVTVNWVGIWEQGYKCSTADSA